MRISDWSSDVCASDLDGSRTLQTVFDRRSQIQPLLLGVARYTRTLADAVRIEVGDGTLMAAVKAVVSVRGTIAGHESPGPDDDPRTPLEELLDGVAQLPLPSLPVDALPTGSAAGPRASRSEERGVGEERGRSFRTRWAACHSKQ